MPSTHDHVPAAAGGGGDRAEAERWYEAAVAAAEAEDLATAAVALEAALRHDPSRARWHYQLGRWRLRLRQWREAVAALHRAVELRPERAGWHYWLGRAREQRWELAAAAQAYATAVTLAPARTDWADRLAEVERAAGEFRPFQGVLVAHRGRCAGWPENAVEGLASLPSYVGGVEVDVRLSRDGVPVLMHDRRVDRTTDGEGAVADLRYARLRRLRGAAGASVPALSTYLEACAGRGLRQILVDVKQPVAADPSGLAAIVKAVRRSPVADTCVLLVREEAELVLARQVAGDLRLGWFATTTGNVAERLPLARRHGAELLLVVPGGRRYLAHRAAVERARAAGLGAGASTVNSRQALEAARLDSCDVLLTDLCDQLGWFVGATGQRHHR